MVAKERTLKIPPLREVQAVNGSWRDVFSNGIALLSFPYPSKQPLAHAPMSNPNSTQWITERRGRRKEGGERERREEKVISVDEGPLGNRRWEGLVIMGNVITV